MTVLYLKNLWVGNYVMEKLLTTLHASLEKALLQLDLYVWCMWSMDKVMCGK